jgi:hypothetical protein
MDHKKSSLRCYSIQCAFWFAALQEPRSDLKIRIEKLEIGVFRQKRLGSTTTRQSLIKIVGMPSRSLTVHGVAPVICFNSEW